MKATKNIINLVSILVLALFMSTAAHSGTANDAAALNGYNQGKIVEAGNGDRLLFNR